MTGTAGTKYGIDFNPTVDRLRVVNDADQNLRINPNTGLVSADTPLTYAVAPDVNAGKNPDVRDAAYTNNFAGATVTTLLVIDDSTLALAMQGGTDGNPSPNGGILTTPTGAVFGDTLAKHAGFDVAPDGTAYIVGVHPGPDYILVAGNPTTRTFDSRGQIGDGTIPIRDIAVAPTIAFTAENYAVFENAGTATITVKREAFLNLPASVQFTTFSDTASAGSDYATTSGTLTFPAIADPLVLSQTQTFQVPIVNDSLHEEDEFLGLFLSGITAGQGVLGSPSVASLRINRSDVTDTTGPQVLFIGLTGPSRGIDGAVVHFDEDLNPATATTLSNYSLTIFPKGGSPQVKSFTTATYDPITRRVTLDLPAFPQTDFKRMILKVRGKVGGIADVAGNLLDGKRNGIPGRNAVQTFKVFSGTTVKVTDSDGDVATLSIEDVGLTQQSQIDGIRPLDGPSTQLTQFWILDPIALRTTLTGSVTKSTKGDGIIVIAEIIGLDKKEFTPLLTNPSFRVNTLTFSSSATGTR